MHTRSRRASNHTTSSLSLLSPLPQVWRYELGGGLEEEGHSPQSTVGSKAQPSQVAHLVYHEPDERYHLSLWRSRSGGPSSGRRLLMSFQPECSQACPWDSRFAA